MHIALRTLLTVLLLVPILLSLPSSGTPGDRSVPVTKIIERAPKETASQFEFKRADQRALVLQKYLSKYNAPLQYHAQDFVEAADKYNVDWRLVAAISGVESTYGKHTPGGYNGWGWGVPGNGSAIYFDSWRDGIFTVTEGLKYKYIDRGLTDPYSMNRKYAASPTWGVRVATIMGDMDKYSRTVAREDGFGDFQAKPGENQTVTYKNVDAKTAAMSAKLVLKPGNSNTGYRGF